MDLQHAHRPRAHLVQRRAGPGPRRIRSRGPRARGLQHFFNENRIPQAACSLGAAQFCIDRLVEYAKARAPFGKPLASNQAIQFPLVELHTQREMPQALKGVTGSRPR
jgi:alkylation response protein AidB-like acyl-CoA dehydrogenase